MIALLPERTLRLLVAETSTRPATVPRKPARENSAITPRLLSALDEFSERRVLAYTDRVGYGLADGRKTAAYRLAAFYRYDVGLSEDLAFYCLTAWNNLNAPSLNDATLRQIFANAGKYARGAA